MYSYGASEAKQRKESHLAKIRHSRRPAPRRASLDAGARDKEATTILEGDGGRRGLYVSLEKGEVDGGGGEGRDGGGGGGGGKLYVALGKGAEDSGGDGGGRGGGKLYVAVGKDEEDGRSNLLWAARNLLAGDDKLVLLHVHQPAHRIMTGFRMVDASQLQEKDLKAYRKDEEEEMNTLLNHYLDFCRDSLKMQAEALVTEKNSTANGIVKLIEQNHISNLVMGTSSFSPDNKAPNSKVAAIVHQQAKPYCQIFYICNETLACSREATQRLIKVESPQSGYTSTDSDRSEFPARSQSLPSPRQTSFFGSTDQKALQQESKQPVSYTYPLSASITDSTETILGARGRSIHTTTSKGFSLNSCQQSFRGSSLVVKDLDNMNGSLVPVSVASSKEHQHSMIETAVQREVFGQLQLLLDDQECSKREAIEDQQKTARGLFENPMMFKAQENSLRGEKNELEERLTREKVGLENERLHLYNELQKASEQRAELENKLLQTNSLMEELQREKEHAVKQAEEMRQRNGSGAFVFGSTSTSAIVLTDFSYAEIKEATNNFDASKKIGEGGCGSVYKGFLRHTTVAIKKLNSEGARGDQEFNDEVETLCGMRHPNLVTLIGACREARVLVFEFLSNGSLEDCLQCENRRETLSWRMRVRIAADICMGLIFLHSNKPKGIAHGDLKPDNVLLDANFVCKLADFGISRPLNVTNTTITPYHRTNQLKGTMGYMDPVYIASGELTAQYDVYSFGVVLMRLLTSKSPLGLPHVVEGALRKDKLQDIIDTSAGEWPPKYTKELAKLALRCCRYERKEQPDLRKEVWDVLEAMMNCPDDKRMPPKFLICPTTQEIMKDPHIAADGYTYEGAAIKCWFKMGNKMSPVTRVSFAHHELIPNNALRFAIQEWKKRQQP
nr:U-box domain-containing protein 33-like [Aegilops tauschii subsp. strangulata]